MKIITNVPFRYGLSGLLCCTLITILTTLLILPARAATDFEDSVPIETVRHLLNIVPGGGNEPGLYQDIMDDFPAFTLPDDTEVLASLDLGYQRRVLLESHGDPDEALTALLEQFVDGNWVLNTAPDISAEQRGFVSSIPPPSHENLCHPEQGNLQISVREQILDLSLTAHSAFAGMLDCNRNNEISAMQMARFRTGLMQYMPRLEIPRQDQSALPMPGLVAGAGMSSSDREVEARATMVDETPLAEIFGLFRTQIEEQGWSPEAENIVGSVAIGTWRRSEDDIDLAGTLTISGLGDDRYDLRFRIIRQGAANTGGPTIRAFRPAP